MIERLDNRIAAHSLLNHAFYVAWREGRLSMNSLRNYAAEYYHFTVAIPQFLESMLLNAHEVDYKVGISQNLEEEKKHPELWLRFCDALNLSRNNVINRVTNLETEKLIQNLLTLSRKGLVEGATAIYAYERQIPEVALSKIDGLKRFYGITSDQALEFFLVHTKADLEHVKIWQRILEEANINEPLVMAALDDALDSLWKMLDGVYK